MAQLSNNLVDFDGDPFKALKRLASFPQLKQMAIAAATAGLCAKLCECFTVANTGKTFEFVAEMKKAGIRAGVNAGVNAAVAGKGFGLAARDALLTGVVSLGAGFLSSQIGKMYSPDNPDGTPNLNKIGYWEHKFMHAGLGGLTAAALGNDIGAGAIGAAVGEAIAEKYADLCLRGDLEEEVDLKEVSRKGMLFGRLAAAFGAHVAGCDPQEADRAAAVALENNFRISMYLYSTAMSSSGVVLRAGMIATRASVQQTLLAIGTGAMALDVYDAYEMNGLEGAYTRMGYHASLIAATGGLGELQLLGAQTVRLCKEVPSILHKSYATLRSQEAVQALFRHFSGPRVPVLAPELKEIIGDAQRVLPQDPARMGGLIGDQHRHLRPSSSFGKVVQNYNVRSADGPLKDDIAKTFAGADYDHVITNRELILYRIGNKNYPVGNYFSTDKAMSILQGRVDKAVLPVWPEGGVSIVNSIIEVRIPANTTIYVGRAGVQKGVFLGGTEQIVIPNAKELGTIEVIKIEALR